MNNKSYAKCRLCEYKGSCAFNQNGDQELCELNVTHLDLADHDKQIIENTFKTLNQALKDLGKDTIPRWILDGVADKVKAGK